MREKKTKIPKAPTPLTTSIESECLRNKLLFFNLFSPANQKSVSRPSSSSKA